MIVVGIPAPGSSLLAAIRGVDILSQPKLWREGYDSLRIRRRALLLGALGTTGILVVYFCKVPSAYQVRITWAGSESPNRRETASSELEAGGGHLRGGGGETRITRGYSENENWIKPIFLIRLYPVFSR